MDITLETVRDVFRRSLGPDAFAAAFIEQVVPDPTIPTACINAQGALRYNPEFVSQHVRSSVDLFCLLFHELLHPAFGHFIHPTDDVANIACDAIINAIITHVFAEPSGGGSLFLRAYPERGLPALLRPHSAMNHSRYQLLYRELYPQTHGVGSLSTGEVIQALRTLVPPSPKETVLLLGSHSTDKGQTPPTDRWPTAVASRIADDLLHAIQHSGSAAGTWPHLQELLIEVLKRKKTVREDLLARYATRRAVGQFFHEHYRPRRVTSPFPVRPSRRDLVLLSAGVWPGLFRCQQQARRDETKGVAVFLDVSGSVNEHLPGIVGLLTRYRYRIDTVYQFSNTVAETSLDSLAKGHVRTTYGTDFDCVARVILDKECDRAVIFTDGYASLDDEHTHALTEAHPHILTILFAGKTDCPDLQPFGEVMQLVDVIE